MKNLIKQIAAERIEILLGLAEKEKDPYSEYAKYYVRLARRISEHYKITINKKRYKVCKNCNALLIPGRNAVVRVSSYGYIVYRCERCGKEVHLHYYKPGTLFPKNGR
ncbi:MAG: ribonuclease P protein component 4 [Candidatus Micrarchaeia archaeon]